jgi:23S rRNA (guanosine2251-2'-O)-methyltransferase
MSRKPLLGSHQRSWIWGRNLVAETLRAGKWTPYELRLTPEAERELRSITVSQDVPVHIDTHTRLTQLCGASDHQGVLAKMPPFPYADAKTLLDTAGRNSLFVLTDHLQDPYNFGAIVRSAECFGVTGLFIPKARQVGVTSQVARSSAGAVNHVPIAQVDDLRALADELKQHGVRLVAASEHAATPLHSADLAGSLAIVIGNEGVGVSRELLDRCDLAVSIPLAGQVGSLNAAVAAGIVIYEASRRRQARESRG